MDSLQGYGDLYFYSSLRIKLTLVTIATKTNKLWEKNGKQHDIFLVATSPYLVLLKLVIWPPCHCSRMLPSLVIAGLSSSGSIVALYIVRGAASKNAYLIASIVTMLCVILANQ